MKNIFKKLKYWLLEGACCEGIINKYRSKNSPTIYFNELQKLPYGSSIEFYSDKKGSVKGIKVDTPNNHITFRVEMENGAYLVDHNHDCREVILVASGKIREEHTGKLLVRGVAMELAKYQFHKIVALEDTIFYIEFKHPNTNGRLVTN